MDTSNRSDANRAVGESGDWKAQLQRQRTVSKIMDTLKKHIPFTGYERLQELKKIAERVEQEVYAAATSQSEYSRMICFMMLTMETRLQNTIKSNSAALVPFDSAAQTGNPNGEDWQQEVYQKIKDMKDLYLLDLTAPTGNTNGDEWREEMYQKIKAMKDLYLADLNDMHQKIMSKLKQYDFLPQQPYNEQLEKLKVFKSMLERFMQFLQIPKHGILTNYKDKLGTYEKQIINVINSNRRKPAAPQQQEASSTSLVSAAQHGNPYGEDWQEEVYQKIKAMKDLYLLDLNDMYHKLLSKLQQHDSLPQQPKNEQLEKMKVFKNMLERYMQFLQTPKYEILANYKDKLGSYERQIIDVIDSNRRKPAALQQQAQA